MLEPLKWKAEVRAITFSPATRVFDELYFVGENAVSAWVLDTGDGLILFDALYSPEDMTKTLEPGLRSLGLDPARIRYLVITHAHGDHYGGARYLKEHYGTQIMASTIDWRMLSREWNTCAVQRRPPESGVPSPSRS